MKKALIWGTGSVYDQYILALKYYECTHDMSVIGVTSKERCYEKLDGYSFYSVKEIQHMDFDYLIVAAGKELYAEIVQEAKSLGIDETKILPISLFAIPGFDIEKYLYIRNEKLSVIAINCWGGVTLHKLELPFLSPFVNLWLREDQYLKLLKNLKEYLESELKFERWDCKNSHTYPVMKLRDIELFFLHYNSIEEARDTWNRRVKRVNYDNLFVMMLTRNEDTLEQFDQLPYKNKVCFCPFKSDLSSAFYLKVADRLQNIPLDTLTLQLARGNIKEYNVIDLLSGEKVRRIDD